MVQFRCKTSKSIFLLNKSSDCFLNKLVPYIPERYYESSFSSVGLRENFKSQEILRFWFRER